MRTIEYKELMQILNDAEAIRFNYNALVYPSVDLDEGTIYIEFDDCGDRYEYAWDEDDIDEMFITEEGYITILIQDEKFRIDVLNITKLK